jgi:hypothetical protein
MTTVLTQLQSFAAACRPGAGGMPDFLFPTWYKYLEGETVGGTCSVVFAFPDDLGAVVIAIVEMLLRLAGLVAVVFVIYGGFKYITSQGSPDSTKVARETIQNALIGLVIAIMASAIVGFIAQVFTS